MPARSKCHLVAIRLRVDKPITATQARYAVWNAIHDMVIYGAEDSLEPWGGREDPRAALPTDRTPTIRERRGSAMIFRCNRCGEEWPDHPVTRVPCPTCRARVGAWCRRPSGHQAHELHVDREHAALAAGVLQKCTATNPDVRVSSYRQLRLDL